MPTFGCAGEGPAAAAAAAGAGVSCGIFIRSPAGGGGGALGFEAEVTAWLTPIFRLLSVVIVIVVALRLIAWTLCRGEPGGLRVRYAIRSCASSAATPRTGMRT